MKKFPSYVFEKKMSHFFFIEFTEAIINKNLFFFQTVVNALKAKKSFSLSLYEQTHEGDKKFISDFNLNIVDENIICKELMRDKNIPDVPYLGLLSSGLFFSASKGILSIYCDRDYDVCIIGCDQGVISFFENNDDLGLMNAEEYCAWLKKWLPIDIFLKSEPLILTNYKNIVR